MPSKAFAADHYFEQPSDYSEEFPERVVVEFGSTWRQGHFEEMSSLFTSEWRESKEDPAEFLQMYAFGDQTPIGFYTTGTSKVSDTKAKTSFTALLSPSIVSADYDRVKYEVSLLKKEDQWKIDFPSMRDVRTEHCIEKSGGAELCRS